jgi:hypothetical protein
MDLIAIYQASVLRVCKGTYPDTVCPVYRNVVSASDAHILLTRSLWRYGFETNWDLSTVKDIQDYNKSCAVKTGIASRPHTFMLNNHFSNSRIGLPSRAISEEINQKDFLQARLDACTEIVGRRTNFLAVDFWSLGDVVEVVNNNNAALPAGENIFVK